VGVKRIDAARLIYTPLGSTCTGPLAPAARPKRSPMIDTVRQCPVYIYNIIMYRFVARVQSNGAGQ